MSVEDESDQEEQWWKDIVFGKPNFFSRFPENQGNLIGHNLKVSNEIASPNKTKDLVKETGVDKSGSSKKGNENKFKSTSKEIASLNKTKSVTPSAISNTDKQDLVKETGVDKSASSKKRNDYESKFKSTSNEIASPNKTKSVTPSATVRSNTGKQYLVKETGVDKSASSKKRNDYENKFKSTSKEIASPNKTKSVTPSATVRSNTDKQDLVQETGVDKSGSSKKGNDYENKFKSTSNEIASPNKTKSETPSATVRSNTDKQDLVKETGVDKSGSSKKRNDYESKFKSTSNETASPNKTKSVTPSATVISNTDKQDLVKETGVDKSGSGKRRNGYENKFKSTSESFNYKNINSKSESIKLENRNNSSSVSLHCKTESTLVNAKQNNKLNVLRNGPALIDPPDFPAALKCEKAAEDISDREPISSKTKNNKLDNTQPSRLLPNDGNLSEFQVKDMSDLSKECKAEEKQQSCVDLLPLEEKSNSTTKNKQDSRCSISGSGGLINEHKLDLVLNQPVVKLTRLTEKELQQYNPNQHQKISRIPLHKDIDLESKLKTSLVEPISVLCERDNVRKSPLTEIGNTGDNDIATISDDSTFSLTADSKVIPMSHVLRIQPETKQKISTSYKRRKLIPSKIPKKKEESVFRLKTLKQFKDNVKTHFKSNVKDNSLNCNYTNTISSTKVTLNSVLEPVSSSSAPSEDKQIGTGDSGKNVLVKTLNDQENNNHGSNALARPLSAPGSACSYLSQSDKRPDRPKSNPSGENAQRTKQGQFSNIPSNRDTIQDLCSSSVQGTVPTLNSIHENVSSSKRQRVDNVQEDNHRIEHSSSVDSSSIETSSPTASHDNSPPRLNKSESSESGQMTPCKAVESVQVNNKVNVDAPKKNGCHEHIPMTMSPTGPSEKSLCTQRNPKSQTPPALISSSPLVLPSIPNLTFPVTPPQSTGTAPTLWVLSPVQIGKKKRKHRRKSKPIRDKTLRPLLPKSSESHIESTTSTISSGVEICEEKGLSQTESEEKGSELNNAEEPLGVEVLKDKHDIEESLKEIVSERQQHEGYNSDDTIAFSEDLCDELGSPSFYETNEQSPHRDKSNTTAEPSLDHLMPDVHHRLQTLISTLRSNLNKPDPIKQLVHTDSETNDLDKCDERTSAIKSPLTKKSKCPSQQRKHEDMTITSVTTSNVLSHRLRIHANKPASRNAKPQKLSKKAKSKARNKVFCLNASKEQSPLQNLSLTTNKTVETISNPQSSDTVNDINSFKFKDGLQRKVTNGPVQENDTDLSSPTKMAQTKGKVASGDFSLITDEEELPTILPPKRRRQGLKAPQVSTKQMETISNQDPGNVNRLAQEFPRHNWLENKIKQFGQTQISPNTDRHYTPKMQSKAALVLKNTTDDKKEKVAILNGPDKVVAPTVDESEHKVLGEANAPSETLTDTTIPAGKDNLGCVELEDIKGHVDIENAEENATQPGEKAESEAGGPEVREGAVIDLSVKPSYPQIKKISLQDVSTCDEIAREEKKYENSYAETATTEMITEASDVMDDDRGLDNGSPRFVIDLTPEGQMDQQQQQSYPSQVDNHDVERNTDGASVTSTGNNSGTNESIDGSGTMDSNTKSTDSSDYLRHGPPVLKVLPQVKLGTIYQTPQHEGPMEVDGSCGRPSHLIQPYGGDGNSGEMSSVPPPLISFAKKQVDLVGNLVTNSDQQSSVTSSDYYMHRPSSAPEKNVSTCLTPLEPQSSDGASVTKTIPETKSLKRPGSPSCAALGPKSKYSSQHFTTTVTRPSSNLEPSLSSDVNLENNESFQPPSSPELRSLIAEYEQLEKVALEKEKERNEAFKLRQQKKEQMVERMRERLKSNSPRNTSYSADLSRNQPLAIETLERKYAVPSSTPMSELESSQLANSVECRDDLSGLSSSFAFQSYGANKSISPQRRVGCIDLSVKKKFPPPKAHSSAQVDSAWAMMNVSPVERPPQNIASCPYVKRQSKCKILDIDYPLLKPIEHAGPAHCQQPFQTAGVIITLQTNHRYSRRYTGDVYRRSRQVPKNDQGKNLSPEEAGFNQHHSSRQNFPPQGNVFLKETDQRSGAVPRHPVPHSGHGPQAVGTFVGPRSGNEAVRTKEPQNILEYVDLRKSPEHIHRRIALPHGMHIGDRFMPKPMPYPGPSAPVPSQASPGERHLSHSQVNETQRNSQDPNSRPTSNSYVHSEKRELVRNTNPPKTSTSGFVNGPDQLKAHPVEAPAGEHFYPAGSRPQVSQPTAHPTPPNPGFHHVQRLGPDNHVRAPMQDSAHFTMRADHPATFHQPNNSDKSPAVRPPHFMPPRQYNPESMPPHSHMQQMASIGHPPQLVQALVRPPLRPRIPNTTPNRTHNQGQHHQTFQVYSPQGNIRSQVINHENNMAPRRYLMSNEPPRIMQQNQNHVFEGRTPFSHGVVQHQAEAQYSVSNPVQTQNSTQLQHQVPAQHSHSVAAQHSGPPQHPVQVPHSSQGGRPSNNMDHSRGPTRQHFYNMPSPNQTFVPTNFQAQHHGAQIHRQPSPSAPVGRGPGRPVPIEPKLCGFTCAECNRKASMICSRCENVRYCSKECQIKGWHQHGKVCKPR